MTRFLQIMLVVAVPQLAFAANTATNASGEVANPSKAKVQSSTAVKTNRRVTAEKGGFTLKMENTSGVAQRCQVYGSVTYKDEKGKSKTTVGSCLLQETNIGAKQTNVKVTVRGAADLAKACGFVGKKPVVTSVKVGDGADAVKCSPVGNEEGDGSVVQAEDDTDAFDGGR